MIQTTKPPPFNDAHITVAALEFLAGTEGQKLRAAAVKLLSENPTPGPAEIAKLRQMAHGETTVDNVHAALAMAACQPGATGAKGKFPQFKNVSDKPRGSASGKGLLERAWFWTTPEALEQASSFAAAKYKAQRFALLQPTAILDLACGIGGDALCVAQACLQSHVAAFDLSAVRCWCLEKNAQTLQVQNVSAVVADVTAFPWNAGGGVLFHLDPARRSAGKRTFAYADLLPGPEFIERLLRRHPDGAIKLSPAVDFESLPTGHVELISEHGVVVQAVLWTGRMMGNGRKDERSATILGNDSWTITGKPEPVSGLVEAGKYFYEVSGAVVRAGLAAALAKKLHLSVASVDGGYLTGDSPLEHPALHGFEVIAAVPWLERQVARLLASMPANGEAKPVVEVKTRGGLGLDTDGLQKSLSQIANSHCTVLIFRGIGGITAVVARRAKNGVR